jgi:dihydrofolate synthase/folylpolyglutamate synthase
MQDIIKFIKEYEVKGSKFGLGRTKELLKRLSYPDKNLKIIHVAGTNGKGSTCRYLTDILVSAKKSVGTFTSPEVYSYEEKFLINGKPMERQKLEGYLNEVYLLSLENDDRATAFEIETVAALYAFYREGCQYAVIECGMGGLNDSTNAISSKEIAAITSISLEHTAILGDTIEEICSQKAGIIKDCPAVVSSLQTPQGLNYFSKLGVQFAGNDIKIIEKNLSGQKFAYKDNTYTIKMLGDEQVYNAAVAIDCAHLLGIDQKVIERGISLSQMAGRVQITMPQGNMYILDGSHNPASFSPLIQALEMIDGDKQLIFSCLSDKDVYKAASLLCPLFKRIIVFTSPSYRAMDIDKMRSAFLEKCTNLRIADGLQSALNMAAEDESSYAANVICGSFTILKEAKNWIDKRQ